MVLERAKIVLLCQLQLYVSLSRSAFDIIAVDVQFVNIHGRFAVCSYDLRLLYSCCLASYPGHPLFCIL